MSCTHSLAALVILAAVGHASDVWVVDATGNGDFVDLPPAVAAAANGDTLLVRGGSYSGFVLTGKGLSVVAQAGAGSVDVGHVRLEGIGAGDRVVLSGLNIVAPDWYATTERAGLELDQLGAAVRVQDCFIRGAQDGVVVVAPGDPGGVGVSALAALDVVFTGCEIRGGRGPNGGGPLTPGAAGGSGIEVTGSNVAIYDSSVFGGDGGPGDDGGDGGDGARFESDTIFLSGSTFDGGDGGDAGLGLPGVAGANLWIGSAATVHLLDTTTAGVVVQPGAMVQHHPGSARRVSAPAQAWEATTVSLTFEGLPGDQVWLPSSWRTAWSFSTVPLGVGAIAKPSALTLEPIGVVPASGVLEVEATVSALTAGESSRLRFAQGLFIAAGGESYAGSPTTISVVDCGFSGDCDGNGQPDQCELQSGMATDCNGNGVLDVCDVLNGTSFDCNANGLPDPCDIAQGTSLDTDRNGIPDECDGLTLYVDDDGGPLGTGTSANPFDSLGKAFAVASSGNSIVVRDGTYTGPENRNLSFAGRDLVVRSENGPSACIIDCQSGGRAFVLEAGSSSATRIVGLTIVDGSAQASPVEPQNGGGILVQSGADVTLVALHIVGCVAPTAGGAIASSGDSNIVLEQCTLTANQAWDAGQNSGWGGGLAALGSGGSVVLRGCTVTDNTARLACGLSLACEVNVVEDCLVADNQPVTPQVAGGGIRHTEGDLVILRSTVSGHTGANNIYPGTIYGVSSRLFARNFTLSHSRVVGNKGAGDSSIGGVFVDRIVGDPGGVTLKIEDSLIADNEGEHTSGLYVRARFQDTVIIEGTTIAGSPGVDPASTLTYFRGAQPAPLRNCILWPAPGSPSQVAIRLYSTILDVAHCDVKGGQGAVDLVFSSSINWGPGNLDVDPLFADPDGADDDATTWLDNDFHLGPLSPCADAGDNSAVGADVFDLDGDLDVLEPIPFDLDLLPRFEDDPAVPDTGAGTAPIVDMGAYERP